jgi:hypothetical protein
MDIPCAILIAAFCLPDTGLKLEVKSDPGGSVAIVTSGEVRARILLSDDEGAPPARLGTQLCHEGACVDYSARIRPDASSVEVLIAARGGQERFIQFRGPLRTVSELSTRMTYVVEHRRRWVQIPLSAFLASADVLPAQPR